MSSTVPRIFETELTGIPRALKEILGDYYNNALCNAFTWLFVLFTLMKLIYHKLFDDSLKRQGFPQYLRIRISNSVWHLAFILSFFMIYFPLMQFNMPNFKTNCNKSCHSEKFETMFGWMAILSYCFQTFCNDLILYGWSTSFWKLLLVPVFADYFYRFRLLNVYFTFTALICVVGVFEELTKLSYSMLNKGNRLCSVVTNALFITTLILYSLVQFIIIPAFFLWPVVMTLLSLQFSVFYIILFDCLLLWLTLVIYKSIVFNLVFHWLYHVKKVVKEDEEKQKLKLDCLGNLIECSLFPPRRDDGFMIAFMRSEIKNRQNKMIEKRKPKNRNMIIQTLKCMMVIKKKLSETRAENSDTDDSDESDDKTELEECEESYNSEQDKQEILNRIKASNKLLSFSNKQESDTTNMSDDDTEIEIKNIDPEEKGGDDNEESETSKVTNEDEKNISEQDKKEILNQIQASNKLLSFTNKQESDTTNMADDDTEIEIKNIDAEKKGGHDNEESETSKVTREDEQKSEKVDKSSSKEQCKINANISDAGNGEE